MTAYSETDLYGNATYYYLAKVELQSNGLEYTAESPNPSTTWANAYIYYQGAAGNTYTATGVHTAVVAAKWIDQSDDDFYGLINWEYYDIVDPWQFPFTAFSPDTIDYAPIPLGSTYDTAETTIPATCGDQRDTIVQEYVAYGTPYYPGCSEFTQTLVDQYFSFGQVNSGNYSWAILRSYFMSNMDSLEALAPFTVNSAYRNPQRNTKWPQRMGVGISHLVGTNTEMLWTLPQTQRPGRRILRMENSWGLCGTSNCAGRVDCALSFGLEDPSDRWTEVPKLPPDMVRTVQRRRT